MAGKPTTIAEYIDAAPAQGQPHLKQLYAVLKSVAPDAQEAIKWGNPFFIEPRFLFAFSAHKAHVSFAPTAESLAHFSDALKVHQTTKHFLKVPYLDPLPEALIRDIAAYCVSAVAKRADAAFWPRENFSSPSFKALHGTVVDFPTPLSLINNQASSNPGLIHIPDFLIQKAKATRKSGFVDAY